MSMFYAYFLGTSSHPSLTDASNYYKRDMNRLLRWLNKLLVDIRIKGLGNSK